MRYAETPSRSCLPSKNTGSPSRVAGSGPSPGTSVTQLSCWAPATTVILPQLPAPFGRTRMSPTFRSPGATVSYNPLGFLASIDSTSAERTGLG